MCVICMLSGIVGSGLHYRAKMEFALERQPDLKGFALVKESALKGNNPPLLAPGAMIVLGLIGMVWTMTLKNGYRIPDTGYTGDHKGRPYDTITGEPQ
jgi:hypothetical protein